MSKFVKVVLILTFVLICLSEFFIIYTRFNDNYKIQQLELKSNELEINLNKLQYAFENRQKLDTIVLNINNKVVSSQTLDTINVKFCK